MKKTPFAIALAATLVMCLAAPSAFAWRHGPRVYFGFNFGPYPYPYPFYYPPYYYPAYYPVPLVLQRPPTVYLEQQPAPAASPAPAGYWYYCADARAYYPYVKECPAGWQRVAPQPG